MTIEIDPERHELRALLDLAHLEGQDVLEIGSGDGRLTWRYAHLAASVLAIEPKATLVEQARAAMPEPVRSTVTLVVGDVTDVDLPARAFDVALFSRSL